MKYKGQPIVAKPKVTSPLWDKGKLRWMGTFKVLSNKFLHFAITKIGNDMNKNCPT